MVPVDPPGDSTPSTVKPPPRRTAVQPSGTLPTARSTRPAAAVVTVMSKLGFEPGETAIAGNGVVSVTASAAPTGTAAASDANPSRDAARPSLNVRDRTDQATATEPPPRVVSAAGSGVTPRARGARDARTRTAASLTPRRWKNQPTFGEETAIFRAAWTVPAGPDHRPFDDIGRSGDTPWVTRPTRRPGSSAQTTLPARRADTSMNSRPGRMRPTTTPAAQPIAHHAITARQKARTTPP